MRVLRWFKGELVQEVRGWVDDGLIASEQGEAILARYQRSLADADQPGAGYRVLMALAVLFGGAALLLVLSHNWDELSRLGRMIGLMGFTALLNGAGLLWWWRGQRDTAVLWLFAGGISYGASLMLIGQIYHLGEHYPDGFLWWALGVLPLAWLTASRLLHGLQLSVATVWMFTEQQFALPWLMPLFIAAALYQVLYRKRQGVLLIAAVSMALYWCNLVYAEFYHAPFWNGGVAAHVGLTAILLLLVFGLALTQRQHPLPGRRRDAALLLHWLGRITVLTLLIFSEPRVWSEFLFDWMLYGRPLLWLLAGVLMALLALTPWLTPPARRLLAAAAVMLTAMLGLAGSLPEERLVMPLTIVTNLLLLAAGIGLIAWGLRSFTARRFYAGVVLLLTLMLVRYISLIGDYLTSALLFALAGGVLFASARYWRRAMAAVREVPDEQ